MITQAVIATAIRPEGARPADREAAELLERVYFSALIGWATGADGDDRMAKVVRRATARILTAD